MKHLIAPSILSANFAKLGEEIEEVMAAGADLIHVDVMDNHFVPNLTIGPAVCASLRKAGITATFDVHLMIDPVDAIVPAFAKAGADYITFHPEATKDIHRTIQLIKDNGCKVGLAFNPESPIDPLNKWMSDIDLVLMMTVHPGFGGQAFITEVLPKIAKARKIIDANKPDVLLSVDGGINFDTIADVVKAGANIFVAGSAIYHSENYAETIQKFRDLI